MLSGRDEATTNRLICPTQGFQFIRYLLATFRHFNISLSDRNSIYNLPIPANIIIFGIEIGIILADSRSLWSIFQ